MSIKDEIRKAKRFLEEMGYVVMLRRAYDAELEKEYENGHSDGEQEEKQRWDMSEPDEVYVAVCQCGHDHKQHAIAGNCTACICAAFVVDAECVQ